MGLARRYSHVHNQHLPLTLLFNTDLSNMTRSSATLPLSIINDQCRKPRRLQRSMLNDLSQIGPPQPRTTNRPKSVHGRPKPGMACYACKEVAKKCDKGLSGCGYVPCNCSSAPDWLTSLAPAHGEDLSAFIPRYLIKDTAPILLVPLRQLRAGATSKIGTQAQEARVHTTVT